MTKGKGRKSHLASLPKTIDSFVISIKPHIILSTKTDKTIRDQKAKWHDALELTRSQIYKLYSILQ